MSFERMIVILYYIFTMRVPYVHPSSHHFDEAFGVNFRGGSLSDIKIHRNINNQRGGNLFGILGRSIKRAIPFIKSLILPELGNFTKNVMEDISQNIPPKQSIKSNLKKSVKNVGKKILRGGGGGKVKRKVGSKKNGKRVNNGKLLENHKKYVKRGAEGKCDFMEDDIFSSEKYV